MAVGVGVAVGVAVAVGLGVEVVCGWVGVRVGDGGTRARCEGEVGAPLWFISARLKYQMPSTELAM